MKAEFKPEKVSLEELAGLYPDILTPEDAEFAQPQPVSRTLDPLVRQKLFNELHIQLSQREIALTNMEMGKSLLKLGAIGGVVSVVVLAGNEIFNNDPEAFRNSLIFLVLFFEILFLLLNSIIRVSAKSTLTGTRENIRAGVDALAAYSIHLDDNNKLPGIVNYELSEGERAKQKAQSLIAEVKANR